MLHTFARRQPGEGARRRTGDAAQDRERERDERPDDDDDDDGAEGQRRRGAGTKEQIFSAVGSHPIYCHLLNWGPSNQRGTEYSWQNQAYRSMRGNHKPKGTSMPFQPLRELSADRKLCYRYDPTVGFNYTIWPSMPYLLASLLTTYLPRNEATADELVEALCSHPMYGLLLSRGDGALASNVAQGLRAEVDSLLRDPELFERVPPQSAGAAAQGAPDAPRFRALVKPHPLASAGQQ